MHFLAVYFYFWPVFFCEGNFNSPIVSYCNLILRNLVFFPDKSTCSSLPGVSDVLRNSIFCLALVFSPKLNSESWPKDTFSDKWFVKRYAMKNNDDALTPLLSIMISFVRDQ